MREDNIIDYYKGCLAYTLFIKNTICDIKEHRDYILNNNYINTATMGFISNIFLTIKEGLVEKTDNGFNILVLDQKLEENISMIANKCDDGYIIDNYVFKDKGTLVSELRNKIAHGNFKFDLDNNKIILNINNNEVGINIKILAAFVVSSLGNYLKNYNTNEYKRKATVNNKILGNRTKMINNKSELINFIKKYRRKIITLRSKDKTIIPLRIIKGFDELVNIFCTNYDESIFYYNKNIFEQRFGKNYEIIYENKKFYNIDYSSFANYILKTVKEDATYIEQALIIAKELERCNIEENKLHLLIENLYNLVILDNIRKYNTTNISVLGEKIVKECNKFYISNHTLVSSLITCFNSLFSYGKDNIYKNRNKYTIEANDGLDYSKLDLSLFNIEVCNIDTGYIDDLKTRKIAKKNNIYKIEEQINKINDSLDKVKDINVIKTLKENIINLNNKKIELNNEYNVIDTEYNNANNYYINNIEYLKNERIIDGIRNSIAHGNYYVKYGEDMFSSIIIFEDIYEGKITFKCSITINKFLEFIDINSKIIINFVKQNKIKKLSI